MRILVLFLLVILAFASCGKRKSSHGSKPPHIDPQATTAEYQTLMKELENSGALPDRSSEDKVVRLGLLAGERLMDWISILNREAKNEAEKIQLGSVPRSTPEKARTRGETFMFIYSAPLLKARLKATLAGMPEEMKKVLTGAGDLPTKLEVPKKEFLKHARLIERHYQTAARIRAMGPYLDYLKSAARQDVRGYQYLLEKKITEENITRVPDAEKEKLHTALVSICMNSDHSLEECKAELLLGAERGELPAFMAKYWKGARKNWASFFTIAEKAVRKDVVWSGNTLHVPFNSVDTTTDTFVKVNVEEEFRTDHWSLRLDLGQHPEGVQLIFKKNVVPFVDQIGGNLVTMDKSTPLESGAARSTIRHEFGHVLGLPDCYHEFYDEELEAFVNYQLDENDLMCSRAGSMNDRIARELERVYRR